MDRYIESSALNDSNVEKIIDAIINILKKRGFKDKTHRATISLMTSKCTTIRNNSIEHANNYID